LSDAYARYDAPDRQGRQGMRRQAVSRGEIVAFPPHAFRSVLGCLHLNRSNRMGDVVYFWIDQVLRFVPIVTWMGLSVALVMMVLWFAKRWAPTPVLALVCVLYAVTPYLPAANNMLPH
jgi:hypothetical protein